MRIHLIFQMDYASIVGSGERESITNRIQQYFRSFKEKPYFKCCLWSEIMEVGTLCLEWCVLHRSIVMQIMEVLWQQIICKYNKSSEIRIIFL